MYFCYRKKEPLAFWEIVIKVDTLCKWKNVLGTEEWIIFGINTWYKIPH